jgi:hypothetical protein
MEDDLTRFYLEGCGGGTLQESYDLDIYFAARHTALDCVEKRGIKGYYFIIGDEQAYPHVRAEQVANLVGDKLQGDIPIKSIISEAQKLYRVCYVYAATGSYPGNTEKIRQSWVDLLGGEYVLDLETPEAIAELIATQIGLCEGRVGYNAALANLKDAGASDAVIGAVSTGLARYAAPSMEKVAQGVVPSSGEVVDSIERT